MVLLLLRPPLLGATNTDSVVGTCDTVAADRVEDLSTVEGQRRRPRCAGTPGKLSQRHTMMKVCNVSLPPKLPAAARAAGP